MTQGSYNTVIVNSTQTNNGAITATTTILNGRVNNLEYGSYAPGALNVFIDDPAFVERWKSPHRWYVASEDEKSQHLVKLVGQEALHAIAKSGGKTIYTNQ